MVRHLSLDRLTGKGIGSALQGVSGFPGGTMISILRLGLITACTFFGLNNGLAQQKPAGTPPPPQAQAPASSAAGQIDSGVLAVLIKSAIVALQQANATGNYSVLRDLGTPTFRERYDQARLTEIFKNLRTRGINLSGALMLMPNLSKQPEMTPQGQLHVVGY